jgi:hypothetical protein
MSLLLLHQTQSSIVVLSPVLDSDGYGDINPQLYGNNTILRFNATLTAINIRSRLDFHAYNLTIDCVSGRSSPLIMSFDDDVDVTGRLRLFGNNSRIFGCQLHVISTYGIRLAGSNCEVDTISVTGHGSIESHGIWVSIVGAATIKASTFTSLTFGVNVRAAASVAIASSAYTNVTYAIAGFVRTAVHDCIFTGTGKGYSIYLAQGGVISNCSFGHMPGCPSLSKANVSIPTGDCLPTSSGQHVQARGDNITIVNNTFVINVPRAWYFNLTQMLPGLAVAVRGPTKHVDLEGSLCQVSVKTYSS